MAFSVKKIKLFAKYWKCLIGWCFQIKINRRVFLFSHCSVMQFDWMPWYFKANHVNPGYIRRGIHVDWSKRIWHLASNMFYLVFCLDRSKCSRKKRFAALSFLIQVNIIMLRVFNVLKLTSARKSTTILHSFYPEIFCLTQYAQNWLVYQMKT